VYVSSFLLRQQIGLYLFLGFTKPVLSCFPQAKTEAERQKDALNIEGVKQYNALETGWYCF